MSHEEPPDGTITGYEGPTVVAPEAEFSPTSAHGDGALHVRGVLAGFIYAEVKYPEPARGRKRAAVWTFTALGTDHHDLAAFGDQASALAYLIQIHNKTTETGAV